MTAMTVCTPRNADEPVTGVTWPMDFAAAQVISRDGRQARITYEGAVHEARIAFGCLVQPEPGDRVMIGFADDTMWIVSVLLRQSDAPPRLWSDGELRIEAARAVTIDAGEINLHASVARFVLDELMQIGRRASWYVSKLRNMGEVMETFAEHVLTRAKRSSRFIEESDQMRAADIDHRAEGTLQLHAEAAFISAETVVRVDAEQIHMG